MEDIMIKIRNVIWVCVLALLFLISDVAGDTVSREVLSSGGTAAASPDFFLLGTIGQAIVGSSTSSQNILNSGFWSVIKFQTPSCCHGRVGDVNRSGEDEPTIGDISTLIDCLFISGNMDNCPCLEEADMNQSGGCNPDPADVTISDISTLIDYLFITGPSLGLPNCLNCP
jgi:hypothetical protein